MQSQDVAIKTLISLGLSVLQARVYIALARSGTQNGRATAKAAKVAPQDVYRVLNELQERGLVEKILSQPNQYKPIPWGQGVLMLFEQRNKQTIEIKKLMYEVSKKFTAQSENDEEITEFALLPAQKTEKNKGRHLFETAQISIDLINNFEESMPLHVYHFEREMEALDRGVKIREILSYNRGQIKPSKQFLTLKKRKPSIQVKYIKEPETAKMIIKDKKEILISTKKNANVFEQQVLWTNNPTVVQIVQQWYDTLWKNSTSSIQKKPKHPECSLIIP